MPSETASEIASRLGLTGPSVGKQMRRLIGRLLDRHRLAQQLFLGDNGEPTPIAAQWLKRLAHDNYVQRSAFHQDPREHAMREGRRMLALEILTSVRIDTERLDALTKLEREL